MWEITQGTQDPNNAGTNNRIGDEIMLNGVSIKYMVELNERYSDATFRMFVMKKAKGDTLNASTFFTGTSGNKMIDTINTERFTVVKSKTFKINNSLVGATDGLGITSSSRDRTLSRAIKILKFCISGSSFGRKKNYVRC